MVANACMRALYYAYMCIVVASVLTCPAVYIPSLDWNVCVGVCVTCSRSEVAQMKSKTKRFLTFSF